MVNNWPIVKFGSLYQEPSRNGLTKPKKVRGEGLKFINMGEIFKFGRMANIPCDRVPVTDKEKSASLMQDGDLLFARQSLVLSGAGKCSIFLGDEEEVVFESHLIRVRLNTKVVNPEYVFYYFMSPQGRSNMSTIVEQGAGQAGIRGSDLQTLNFPLPPKKYQDYIVSCVSPCDLKIELNEKNNQILEQMAQALFKSWFVDFDPVIDNALAAGNDIPEALQHKAEQRAIYKEKAQQLSASLETKSKLLPDGLPQEIRELFPSEFEQTGEPSIGIAGWIPKGWESSSLGKKVTVKRGGSPRPIKDFIVPEGLPWTKISDATASNSRFIKKTKEFIKPEGLSKTTLLKKGTLILSNSATPGLPKFLDLDACVHDGWLHFPAKDSFTDLYLYQLFLVVRKQLVQQGNGSVFTNLKTDILKDHKVVVPDTSTLLKFDELMTDFNKKLHEISESTATLERTRDTILPKLISGEITLNKEVT